MCISYSLCLRTWCPTPPHHMMFTQTLNYSCSNDMKHCALPVLRMMHDTHMLHALPLMHWCICIYRHLHVCEFARLYIQTLLSCMLCMGVHLKRVRHVQSDRPKRPWTFCSITSRNTKPLMHTCLLIGVLQIQPARLHAFMKLGHAYMHAANTLHITYV